MANDSHVIHRRFLKIAEPLSPVLALAMERGGPVEFRRRRSVAFPVYLCRAVAGQQLSTAAARTIWGRVEEGAGGGPLLDHFLAADPELLRGCGLSAAKAKTMRSIAEAARDGGLETRALKRLDSAGRTARMTAIWGVGQWTADMMNIFYFGDEDIWPDGDVSARKTLEKLTSRRRKTIRTAALFAPHRSYLALYMWRHTDAPPVES